MATTWVKGLFGLEDARAARGAWRILLPACTIVVVAVAVALSTNEPRTARLFDNVYWTVAYVAGAALAWLGVRTSSAREQRPKRWFAWALSTYAVGQVLWDVQVLTGWNPFPGPSDLFFVLLGPLTGIGCVGLLSRAERRTTMLDAAGLSVAVLALTLAIYLPKRGDTALLPLCFLVAYPVALCWAASTALVAVLTLRLPPTRGLLLFGLGLFGNAALWLQWNSLTLDDALGDGTLLNALFPVGALAQGLGALLVRTDLRPSKAWERFCEGTLRLLPLFIVVVCAAAVVLAFTLHGVPGAVRWSALCGGLVVVVIATLRQSLLLGEREQLIATERELRRAEEHFRVLIEQAPDGIFITDSRGVYTEVNGHGAEMLGMTRDEVIGKSIADVVDPEELPRIPAELERISSGDTRQDTWRFRRKDGSTFQGEVTAKQLPDGRVQGFLRDVSDRIALEAQLRQSQKMEAMGVLASGIAHDFNNILTAIRGNASLVALDVGREHPAATYVDDIERAAGRATELVQRILAFSRPSPPVNQRVLLTQVVDEVVKLLRPSLPAGIELKLAPCAASPTVSADPAQLHQVLMNLCANAWQAMAGKPGSIELRVEVRKLYGDEHGLNLPAGDYACISVTDTGLGMSPQTQERVFEPFFTTKAPGSGTGLGLSVVHGIVRSHGGGIRVKSSLGQGSTFSIYLPCAGVGAGEGFAAESAHSQVSPRGSRVRVAYVDDEAQIVSVMVRQLERRGYAVRGFTEASELLRCLEAEAVTFEVLVTDYNMPRISGLELVRQVRALRPGLGYVLTSGYLSDEVRASAAALGISQLVKKPEVIERLCQAIEAAASDAQHRSAAAGSPAA